MAVNYIMWLFGFGFLILGVIFLVLWLEEYRRAETRAQNETQHAVYEVVSGNGLTDINLGCEDDKIIIVSKATYQYHDNCSQTPEKPCEYFPEDSGWVGNARGSDFENPATDILDFDIGRCNNPQFLTSRFVTECDNKNSCSVPVPQNGIIETGPGTQRSPCFAWDTDYNQGQYDPGPVEPVCAANGDCRFAVVVSYSCLASGFGLGANGNTPAPSSTEGMVAKIKKWVNGEK